MRGDFSAFWAADDVYSQVFMQQGRVLLDRDWNDSVTALVAGQRRMMADLIGPHGGPADTPDAVGRWPEATRLGFGVAVGDDGAVTIGAGVYYVDGIRCVNPAPGWNAAAGAVPDPAVGVRIEDQPFSPWLLDSSPPAPKPPYLVYLDVWEQHVTALDDPRVREVALGGADTATRARVIWQVQTRQIRDDDRWLGLPDGRSFQALNAWKPAFPLRELRYRLAGRAPALKVRTAEPDPRSDAPCLAPPDAGYRRTENQLYRVEIHSVNPQDRGKATFVWSRENGSVVADWLGLEGQALVVTGVRDKVHGFAPGDWVELTDDRYEWAGRPGPLVRLASIEPDRLLIDPTTAKSPLVEPEDTWHPKVRRWDQRLGVAPAGPGDLAVLEGSGDSGWLRVEDGIEIQFQEPSPDPPEPNAYHVGDYWVFPARAETGSVIWPTDNDDPIALPARGVEHHYAPLAIVTNDNGAVDLRKVFGPLVKDLP